MYTVYEKGKKKHLCRTQKRQQARQWCRNHRWSYTNPLIIEHPCGKREEFQWTFAR